MGTDGKGKVPHSWRVAILPYIEQADLYRQYRFDEPWDSDANKMVLAKMPAIYPHPLDDPKSTNARVLRPAVREAAGNEASPAAASPPPEGGFPTVFSGKNGVNFSQMFRRHVKHDRGRRSQTGHPVDQARGHPVRSGQRPAEARRFLQGRLQRRLCRRLGPLHQHKIDPKTLKLLIMPQDGTAVPQY